MMRKGQTMAREEEDEPLSLTEVASLTKMFEEHRPKLLLMLQSRIDPAISARVTAEDVLHETFLLARRRWPRFATSGMKPYPWLYRLAMDSLIEAWRCQNREARDPHREVAWPDRSSAQQVLKLIDTATTPSEAFAREELRQRVQEVLSQLKPTDREVLWMRHFDQLSFGDLAELLKISENTAMKRYVRALQRLKDLLPDLYLRGDEGQ
jgi:RNA polymerase sigma-70 factor, ECF subfamily